VKNVHTHLKIYYSPLSTFEMKDARKFDVVEGKLEGAFPYLSIINV